MFLNNLSFIEEHFFFDRNDSFVVGIFWTELESNFSLNGQVKTSLPDELFKVTSVVFGFDSVTHNNAL